MKRYPGVKAVSVSVSTSVYVISWLLALALFVLGSFASRAAESTWTGGGENNFWTTAGNWNSLPSANDSLIFTGQTRLINSNTFAAATAFGNLNFSTPIGPFVLNGNSITLNGNITNNQELTLQSVNLP